MMTATAFGSFAFTGAFTAWYGTSPEVERVIIC